MISVREVPTPRSTRVAVVGASAGGFAVAQQLRRLDAAIEMTLIGDELHEPYDRPPLSKHVLDGRWTPDRVALPGWEDLVNGPTHVRLGVAALALDPERRTLSLDDGTALKFEQLVVATGVRPRLPSKWTSLIGVHTLRTLADAADLGAAMRAGETFVVVGAGFIGLEFAAAARARGCEVTVVEPLDQPLITKLGPRMGARVARLHRDRAVDIRLGTGVRDIIAVDDMVTGVELDDGDIIATRHVVVGIGTIPNVEWLESSGLSIDGGLQCDEHLRARKGIYGVGDVVSVWNPVAARYERFEHRASIAAQAGVVARNVLGGDEVFSATPFFWTDQYDVKIQVAGRPDPAAMFEVVQGSIDDDRFVAMYTRGGSPDAILAWNSPRELMSLRVQYGMQ